jgi:hypothetical protein
VGNEERVERCFIWWRETTGELSRSLVSSKADDVDGNGEIIVS